MTGAVELQRTAEEAARRGGAELQPLFRSADLAVDAKAKNDFVTAADRASERVIVELLRDRHPEHAILAEESGALPGEGTGGGEVEWLIDPLDGTANFLHGHPSYAVSVACRRGPELLAGVVYDPEGDNLFSAARGAGARWNGAPMRVSSQPGLAGAFLATGFPFRAHAALGLYLDVFAAIFRQAGGIRRCGAAALDLAYTAAGVYDGFFEFRLAPWDIAAGVVLIREAGGTAVDLDGGDDFLAGGNVLAGGKGVLAELAAVVEGHASEARLDELTPR